MKRAYIESEYIISTFYKNETEVGFVDSQEKKEVEKTEIVDVKFNKKYELF